MPVFRRGYPRSASSLRLSRPVATMGIMAARGRVSTTNQNISLGEPSHLITLTRFLVTLTARVNPSLSGDAVLVAKRNALSAANPGWVIGTNGAGNIWTRWKRATNTTVEANKLGGAPGPGLWFRLVLAYDSAGGAPVGWIDKGADGAWAPVTWNVSTNAGSGAPVSDSGQAVRIGNVNALTLGFAGEIAHVGIWPVIGGVANWIRLAEQPWQFARQALFCAFPGERGNPNAVVDYALRVPTSSIVNTGFYGVSGPDDLYDGGARGMFDGGLVGGTLYVQAVGGGVTPAGALRRAVLRRVAGAGTPAGALVRTVTKRVTGGATPAGALAPLKVAIRAFAGALTPAGALVRQTLRKLAGGATPAGTLVRQTARRLAGGLTPAGVMAPLKVAIRALGGTVAPAGTVRRAVVRRLAGALSPAGAVVRTFISGGGVVVLRLTAGVGSVLRGALEAARALRGGISGRSRTGPEA